MSDDIFSVMTPFADVAEMAQGYVQRADGERIWIPLPTETPLGEAVRFVVHLADGTPAFAGAGRCAQVADQGDAAAAEHRFETLLDSLQFDDRSRPVYDYIVAVRSSVVGDAPSEAAEESGDAQAAVEDEFDVSTSEAPPADGFGDGEATEYIGIPQGEGAVADAQPEPSLAPPEPIPTGMLTRPAIASHWQPAPPRKPAPSPASGLFRYNGSGLPAPERPPWPDIDPSMFVRPALKPMAAGAAQDNFGPSEATTADAEYDASTAEIPVEELRAGSAGSEAPEGGYESEAPAEGTESEAPEAEYESEAPAEGSESEAPEAEYESEAPAEGAESEAPEAEYESEAPSEGAESEAPEGEHESEAPSEGAESEAPEGEYESEAPSEGAESEPAEESAADSIPAEGSDGEDEFHVDDTEEEEP